MEKRWLVRLADCGLGTGGILAWRDSLQQGEHLGLFQWFGKVIVHPGGETALAVSGHRVRGHGRELDALFLWPLSKGSEEPAFALYLVYFPCNRSRKFDRLLATYAGSEIVLRLTN
jgi:hypothetical protein